jgi:exodeoxyribonuclease VII small subunit
MRTGDRGALIRFRTLLRSIAYPDTGTQPAIRIDKLTAPGACCRVRGTLEEDTSMHPDPDMSGSQTAAAAEPATFEQALSELEQLVAHMEEGELSLEAALRAFERGIALTRHCQAALDQAEQTVEILSGHSVKVFESGDEPDHQP